MKLIFIMAGFLNPIPAGRKGDFHVQGGGLLGPLFVEALGGHRHDIFGVHHYQWESMRSDNGSVKKKHPKVLTMDPDSR